MVAEFGTAHIKKAVFLISASIFLENVGGIKLKFIEEIEKNLIAIQVRFSVFWCQFQFEVEKVVADGRQVASLPLLSNTNLQPKVI